jgi:hypothetical protein
MRESHMNRLGAIRDVWHPQTREDRDAILRELQEVLASPHFCNSKRYPALLKYIVENTLAGNSESLKERTLGVEVFDRAPSYATNADTVVRYTAGEVRKRLSLYYHELDRKPVIQISLPAGSYIPEFLHSPEDSHEPNSARSSVLAGGSESSHEGVLDVLSTWSPEISGSSPTGLAELRPFEHPRFDQKTGSRRGWLGIAALLILVVLAAAGWKYKAAHPSTPLDEFWGPVLHDQATVLVCTGGSIFSQTHLSGVATAGKDIDYPFVSMQSASAIAQLSALLAHNGGSTTQLQSAATTPVTELKERPVILLGGYNNQWTLRLLQPLRFHFAPESAGAAIVDDSHPENHWARDPLQPYSSADDYALVVRFRDATTDGWVVALAGLGRNGTEAAAQFATSPHYMQLLKEKVGDGIFSRNIEVVVRLKVIDGKTGAPSIQAVHTW